MLAYNLIRTVIAQAALAHGKQPRQLSFTRALRTLEAFRPTLVHLPWNSFLWYLMLQKGGPDMKEHIVHLTDEEIGTLESIVDKGTHRARVVCRANILLKSNEDLTDREIAEHVERSTRCVADVRKRFCQGGLQRALYDAPRSGGPPKFTRKQQQKVIALACTDPPEGRERWTLELICQHAVAQGLVKSLSKSEVALWLREHDFKPWRKKNLVCAQADG
jgi:transposase